MTQPARLFLAATLALCGAASAAEITVYKQQNFGGENLPLREAAYNLAAHNFHDQISSIVVHTGDWELCTQPNFRGECVILGPGTYAVLDGRINHRIESMREAPLYALDQHRRLEIATAAPTPLPALELFAAPGFMGRSQGVQRDVHTLLETGFDARAASLVVREGTWQGCTEPGYQGVCRVFLPGRYRDASTAQGRIVSLRRVAEPR